MTSPLTFFRSKAFLALALLLCGQAFSAAHAIEYGVEPHEHNGVVCLALCNDEHKGPLPSNQPAVLSGGLDEVDSHALLKQVFLATNLATKPPATGPPSA